MLRPSHFRHLWTTAFVFAVVLSACGGDDGNSSPDMPPEIAGPTFEAEPQPGPVCDLPLSEIGVIRRGGELWTYVDGRPVLVRRGYDGVKTFQERWSYDADGRLTSRERDNDGDDDWDELEAWRYDESGRLIGYERDGTDPGQEVDETWTWTWDAEGRLVVREADLDADGDLDYREETTFPGVQREVTIFDMDGDGREDIRYVVDFDNQGRPYEAERSGQYGDMGPRREYQRPNSFEAVINGPNGFAWTFNVERFDDRTRVLGGRFETCHLDTDGNPTGFELDDDGVLGSGTVSFDRYEPYPTYELSTDPAMLDERGNLDLGGTYDPEFSDAACGSGVPREPVWPQPIVLDDDYIAIDPLCYPEFRSCRFEFVPWRMTRC